mmetsp:Transcript_32251/g.73705  ORF Transcript_32251/g.73705 Transcript_32251/m.73705 type:complete len:279 (-) Transcript_32251:410-1246(-)
MGGATLHRRSLGEAGGRVEERGGDRLRARARADLRVDEVLHVACPGRVDGERAGSQNLGAEVSVSDVLFEGGPLAVRELLRQLARHHGHVDLLHEEHRVGSRVERVRCDAPPRRLVDLVHRSDDGAGGVVEVEDRRECVEARRVEGVALLHSDAGKLLKVLGRDSLLYLGDPSGDHALRTVLQEGAGLDGASHAPGAAHCLLLVAHHQDEGVERGPVALRRSLERARVHAICLHPHLPLDEPAVHGTARGAGALARHHGKIPVNVVEVAERRDQARVP